MLLILFLFIVFLQANGKPHSRVPLGFPNLRSARFGHKLRSSQFLATPDHKAGTLSKFKDKLPSVLNCSEHWFTQQLDRFHAFGKGYPSLNFCKLHSENLVRRLRSQTKGGGRLKFLKPRNPIFCQRCRCRKLINFDWAPPYDVQTFQQRYFLCGKPKWSRGMPILFYCGNEANVELYINATGLMWELSVEMDALLLFAEHRFFGNTQPCDVPVPDGGVCPNMKKFLPFLSVEQAVADYATLIYHLKHQWKSESSRVVAFGGSYGGMLATWLRMKHPSAVVGAIAGSAPVFFSLGLNPPYDEYSFAKVVTFDASAEGGSNPFCADNVRDAWRLMTRLRKTAEGRATITKVFRLCAPLQNDADVDQFFGWLMDAWGMMAMGSYPYPSSYLLMGGGVLPAYPVRVACQALGRPFFHDESLLAGLREAIALFYNYTQTEQCYDYKQSANNESSIDTLLWDYLTCTDLLGPTASDGVADMFWEAPFNLTAFSDGCFSRWGVRPRPYWPVINWGDRDVYNTASNIVFSNGNLDPWIGGGITRNISKSVVAVVIDQVGHHIDLMFSDLRDPPQVTQARELERYFVRLWALETAEK